METLATAMQAKLRRDDSGDQAIMGKDGDILAGARNGVVGYYISLVYQTGRKLHEVLKRFRWAEITQEGDSEAVIFMSRENALARAQDLRVAIKARKRPALSFEQRQRKAMTVALVRSNPDHLVGIAA